MKNTIILLITLASAVGAFAQFGKNKVQYETFEWKYIETKHFDVYFHEGGKYLAEYTAIEAEKALDIIEEELNYKLATRVPFIIFNSHNEFQQTNVIDMFLSEGIGGVTTMFKNRIVLPFPGDWAQFQHVIFHELVHGFLNDMFHGGTVQTSLTTGGFAMPVWMNEGLAEYLSEGGMNTKTDMFMRDLAINENLPPLHRLDGYVAYRGGQTFYWFVAEKYGKEKVGDLINRLRIHRNVNTAFKAAFNLDFEDFNEKWEKELKKYYLPDLEDFDDTDDFAERVTNRKKMGNFYNSSPAISPDGEKIALITEDGGILKIAVMDIDDPKSIRNLVSSFRAQDFEDLNMLSPGISWSPDGKRIAVSAKAGGEDAIFIVDEESGSYEKVLLGLKAITSVQWSPDGNTLAFIGSKAEQGDIYLYSIGDKMLRNLTEDIFSDLYPAWSHDSKTIYFISDREDNVARGTNKGNFKMWNYQVDRSDVYSIDVASGAMKRLTFDPHNEKSSVVATSSPEKIFFISDKNGIGNLYELNTLSNSISSKTNSIHEISQISISRDDSKLVFSTQVEGGYDIYMIKYPLQIKDKGDLPLTKFKQSLKEKQDLVSRLIEQSRDSAGTSEKDDRLIGYGNFEVDLSSQEVVKANTNAVRATENYSEDIIDTNFVEKDYQLKFSPDLVWGAPSYNSFYGFQGLVQMLFSDELGDHQIFLQTQLLMDIQNSTIFAQYSYLKNVIDYKINAFTSAGFVSRFSSNPLHNDSLFRFRNVGVGVGAEYPLDLFRRFELNVAWMNLSKTDVQNPGYEGIYRTLIIPEVRYVYDNTLWGYYAPRVGTRFYLSMKGSPKLSSSGLGFTTFSTDFRTYLPLGDYFGLAFRGSGAGSFGPDPQTFFLGGTENWINAGIVQGRLPFEKPEDFAFMNFQWPLRGYPIAHMKGTKFFLANAEFRFPLLTALVAGPLPILIQGIMGSFFLDVGGAWTDRFEATQITDDGRTEYRDLMYSTGIGIRSYLLGLPLKIDIAWAKTYESWTEPQYLFSLGFDF